MSAPRATLCYPAMRCIESQLPKRLRSGHNFGQVSIITNLETRIKRSVNMPAS